MYDQLLYAVPGILALSMLLAGIVYAWSKNSKAALLTMIVSFLTMFLIFILFIYLTLAETMAEYNKLI